MCIYIYICIYASVCLRMRIYIHTIYRYVHIYVIGR